MVDAIAARQQQASPPAALLPRFACPVCHGALAPCGEDRLRCERDDLDFERIEGIWRFLPPERLRYYARFMAEYETVRARERRGSRDAAYYRALPFADRSGRFSADWRIRARSFEALVDEVLAPLEEAVARPLVVLDLGAGNGWLSHRLAQRGHAVIAADLQTNAADGLGAHVHYAHHFTPVQAEFDHVPLAGAQADLVIFNGSLHYAADIERALAEARRVLRPAGRLVIMDTPFYHDPSSGQAMVREREAQFAREYGFPSNAVPMEGFLTFQRLDALGAALGLRWQRIEPDYGLGWALRPWRARLRRRREPARFVLAVGKREEVFTAVDGSPVAGRLVARGSVRAKAAALTFTKPTEGAESGKRSEPARAIDRVKRGIWRRVLRLRLRWVRGRQGRVALERVGDLELVILPGVFNPRLLRSGAWFAEALSGGLVPPDAAVLDLGTGSGVAALASARRADQVVAVDINPDAVRCARINALLNNVERIEVRQGDLFAPVAGERFDLVLFNPPYYRGEPRDPADFAWRSPDVAERFAAGLAEHLTPSGAALVILSSDGDPAAFLVACEAAGLRTDVVSRRDLINEVFTIYRIAPSHSEGGLQTRSYSHSPLSQHWERGRG
ncbi:MAG TPA: HemK2/MTQ2 family protein methyltransferase [Thermomicrobiaceae bacterium]|nr:HemK2/MTQ2 family protein methyltransferase [Thermomicrobiaceae bacterium]